VREGLTPLLYINCVYFLFVGTCECLLTMMMLDPIGSLVPIIWQHLPLIEHLIIMSLFGKHLATIRVTHLILMMLILLGRSLSIMNDLGKFPMPMLHTLLMLIMLPLGMMRVWILNGMVQVLLLQAMA